MNKTTNENIHNFHFVLDSKLKNKILKFSKELNLTISDTMIYIVNETLSVLIKYQFDIDENENISKYQTINWDTDAHVYFEKNLYRKIKHLAGTKFAFSISIVIRKLIEIYFKYLELSNNNLKRVNSIFKRFHSIYVNNYINKIKKWDRNIKNKQLFGNFYYKLTFNDKFTLTGFDFNNSD